ncbi:DUF6492 family protein [Cohnella nanjingensis]|uniref:Nucleotide-diphospho-sugar transferase domain-containing protein n=1 Tax=Cohnella nanjingensis TaxID=1387779 RepID=A0A7X0RRW3_9BACL|nr:DUF6492 family protein [Cohnella nanjingensis]MBB6671371.1 hypothetical protein [Cohnella nanjingensis]
MIPAIEKDLGTLPHVIDAVRLHVRHPIGRIYVVSPESERIRKLCKRKGCTFVNERKVLPITKNDIHYSSKRWERSGWLYQQLLKLGGTSVVSRKHYLVVDADTVFIRPHRFLVDGKTVFYCRKWSQPEYFVTYRKLTGERAKAPRSFVTHYMLFDKTKVSAMKRDFEAKHGTRWYRAIIRSINKKKQFGFSEYETYGNYLYARHPGKVVMKSAQNKSLHSNAGALSAERIRKLATKFRSLSFHKRKGYAK